MATTKGYSLWIMPPVGVRKTFSELISKLAHEYSTTVFQPHITIVGEILEREYMVEKVMELVATQRSFSVALSKIGYRDSYFDALFINVDRTPQLLQFNDKAKKIFGTNTHSVYAPHLSILYGDIPKTIKNEIAQTMNGKIPNAFRVSSVHLFETEGEVSEWHRVQEFPFGITGIK